MSFRDDEARHGDAATGFPFAQSAPLSEILDRKAVGKSVKKITSDWIRKALLLAAKGEKTTA